MIKNNLNNIINNHFIFEIIFTRYTYLNKHFIGSLLIFYYLIKFCNYLYLQLGQLDV